MKSQYTQVSGLLRSINTKPRTTLTINEAAQLLECGRNTVVDWANLGLFEMNRSSTGRAYVNYESLMDFLGEPPRGTAQ
ncbi:MAG: helix-turn-helix domain-containing protein [Fibrobacteria bacterium]